MAHSVQQAQILGVTGSNPGPCQSHLSSPKLIVDSPPLGGSIVARNGDVAPIHVLDINFEVIGT